MLKVNSQYPSRVKYIKHEQTRNGTPVTKFQIGDKVKDSEQYVNYTVTVYSELALNDGDEVTITQIDSIAVREYNGNQYHDIVAHVVKSGTQPAPQWGNATPMPGHAADELPFDL